MNTVNLFPISRQYAPIDEPAEGIVRFLLEHPIDGINIELYTYRLGTMVSKIEGRGIHMQFRRIQERRGQFNNIAALNDIVINKRSLSVYEDDSGSSLRIYAGNNWDDDSNSHWWSGFNTKLNNNPKKYLIYSGSDEKNRQCRYGRTYPGIGAWGSTTKWENRGIATYLIHNNDLGREYDREDGDPEYYLTKDVLNEMGAEMNAWFEKIKAEVKS